MAKDEKFELRHDGKANLSFTGPILVNGPCLFNLKGEGDIEMKNMQLQGLGDLQKHSSKPVMFKWPLFFYADTEDGIVEYPQ